jgi:hypothetical protein
MIIIVHPAAGMADPVVAFAHIVEGVQKIGPVLVALEKGLSLVTSGGDVIYSTGELGS